MFLKVIYYNIALCQTWQVTVKDIHPEAIHTERTLNMQMENMHRRKTCIKMMRMEEITE